MRIEYTVQIWEESSQYVAHAMPLDVMSSGATPEAARRALDEAVRLFLQTAADNGTMEEVLQEVGYTIQDGQWVSPVWVGVERHTTALAR
jgi:predicted RNase H-like HicB family nuclease